jgi:murein L,D-transpeptidase YafK
MILPAKQFKNKVIKSVLLVTALVLVSFKFQPSDGFKQSQIKYKRVKTAYDNKWTSLQQLLKDKGIATDNFELHLRGFKQENLLEIWARSKGVAKYTLIKTIPICATSGELGPKRKEGDGQVPEGFYEVSWFNPMSDYHLGLKINYPNASDKKKAKGRPGGDIMIHGSCVTIGCIPLQNEPIEELYVLCVESKNTGHQIGVSIYPFKMTDQNFEKSSLQADKEKLDFWKELRPVYKYFEESRNMPKIAVNNKGDYTL